jgi:hypothetical protein
MAKVDNISIDELRTVANYFFDYLENNMNIKNVEVTEDYYWSVLHQHRYDIDQQPGKLGMGQLSEDLYFLKEILKNKDLAAAPNLSHLCAVLEFMCFNVSFKK